MDIKPIRTEQDYEAALARVDELMGAEFGTPEGEELDAHVDLVERYESTHLPMDAPGAIDERPDRSDDADRQPQSP